MIVEDHDMSDGLATYGYKLRPDREASLLSSRCGIRQPVGSNHHHSFLKRSKIDISQNAKLVSGCFGAVGLLHYVPALLADDCRPVNGTD